MIYNVTHETFGPLGTRNGDLIAIINIVHALRVQWNDPELQLHFTPGSLNREDYIIKFFLILTKLTDCFSLTPGTKNLPWKNVSVWDYRDIVGDHAIINNPYNQENKVVVFPVYDAQYNSQRNWSQECLALIIDEVNTLYPTHQKIICAKDPPPPHINIGNFAVSTDFETNINHIMTSSVFYGGDTGVSHFASVLQPGPSILNYMYSSRCLIHTIPFYCISKHKGNLRTFWLDFTGTQWNEN